VSNPVKHRGVVFESGDSFLIVPSLSCAQAEELGPVLDQDQAVKPPAADASASEWAAFRASVRARRQSWLKVITAAVRRNYPEKSPDQIASEIDEVDLRDAYMAAIGISAGAPSYAVLEAIVNSGRPADQILADLRTLVAKAQKRVRDPQELAPTELGPR